MTDNTYTGAPDECSRHWPQKPHECGCEPMTAAYTTARSTMHDHEAPTWTEFEPGNDYGDLPVRTNGDGKYDTGEPCDACGAPLSWDRHEGMVYCMNDWYHG